MLIIRELSSMSDSSVSLKEPQPGNGSLARRRKKMFHSVQENEPREDRKKNGRA